MSRTSGTSRVERVALPLTAEAYAAYGDVICASPRGEEGHPANQGTARRFDRLASLVSARPHAAPNLSVFRCQPRLDFPFEIRVLEKHPMSTQVFVPMNASRFLVVVAEGTRPGEEEDAPDLDTLRVFVAERAQGVSYHPGVWHHPMITLDAVTDFACLVWEDRTPGDCKVVECAAGWITPLT